MRKKRLKNRFCFHGYDCTLAVIARRVLLFDETTTARERFEQVWQPTDKFLEALRRLKPKRITCFAGSKWQFPEGSPGQCVNVYVVNPAREVEYLGTVFDRQAEANDRQQLLSRLDRDDPDQAALLRECGATAIIRDHRFCRIPSDTRHLTQSALTKAVRQFFRVKVPELATKPFVWLSTRIGHQLDREIAHAADQAAMNESLKPWGY